MVNEDVKECKGNVTYKFRKYLDENSLFNFSSSVNTWIDTPLLFVHKNIFS